MRVEAKFHVVFGISPLSFRPKMLLVHLVRPDYDSRIDFPSARRSFAMLRSRIVIPARLASTRLPRKLLLSETGRTLLQHTYESACRATRPRGVSIAADCEEIASAVRSFGGDVVLTSPACASGTDRV